MTEVVAWIAIAFISGSIPWALIVGKVLLSRDIRAVGDGNPGTANSWKLGGWVPGLLSLILDVGKAAIPVYLAFQYANISSDLVRSKILDQIALAMIAISPIVGHAWSPFLKLKGGKALASSWGSWIALTSGLAFPVACLLLSILHVFQRNHAITVTSVLVLFLPIFLSLQFQPYIAIYWTLNLGIVIYKHRHEYSSGVRPRIWVYSLGRGKS
jgi:glycerol-3-phosphate acyltransferase PlsY